jgi:hypothetical protein
MKPGELNFLEYLGNEEQNLLTGIVNWKKEFDLFYDLDRVYQEPLRRMIVSFGSEAVPRLYLFVHFHLYFSASCLLRCHLSETFSSLRKAIDASLCAYRILVKPDSELAYLERDKYFQFIKSNIQREIKKDASLYPLAHDLLFIHEKCSEFGSHSDPSSFIHRLERKKTDDHTRGHAFSALLSVSKKLRRIPVLLPFYASSLLFHVSHL